MTIYGLIDPRTAKIRYIGKSKHPRTRLQQHMEEGRFRRKSHLTCWLRQLKDAGLVPRIFTIEECAGDGAVEEIFHIALAKSDGIDLTNGTAGGDGVVCPSEETRRKMSEARRGKPLKLSPEGLRRLREARRRPHSEAHKQKMREIMTGREYKPEWRKNLSAALRGRPFPYTGPRVVKRKFTDQEEDTICAEYKAGGITKQIAAAHGVTHYLITSILRRHGIPARPHSLLPHQIEKMRASKIGKKQSPELIAKRTAGSKGRPKSHGARLKMIAAQSSDIARALKSENSKRMWRERREGKRAALIPFKKICAA